MTSPALLNDIGHTSSWSLAVRVGVALIQLGGLKFIFLTVSPKFISIFHMLPNPIPYSELELLFFLWHFFNLTVCFLIAFLSLSYFSLICTKEFFAGLGFFLPFFAVQKLASSDLSFSYLWQSLVLCIVCVPPCFLHRLQCFSVWAFLGTLAIVSVPGCLFPFLPWVNSSLGVDWVHWFIKLWAFININSASLKTRDKMLACIFTLPQKRRRIDMTSPAI